MTNETKNRLGREGAGALRGAPTTMSAAASLSVRTTAPNPLAIVIHPRRRNYTVLDAHFLQLLVSLDSLFFTRRRCCSSSCSYRLVVVRRIFSMHLFFCVFLFLFIFCYFFF